MTGTLRIALVMIAKDEKESHEGHCIIRCLDSCLNVIDGAVVVTTGAPDSEPGNVIPLLNMWGAETSTPVEVSRITWEGNFAKARNVSIQEAYEKFPNVDWFLLIDADEMLRADHVKLLDLLHQVPEDRSCVVMNEMSYGEAIPRVVFIRNIPGWAYRFAHHETIQLNGATPVASFIGDRAIPFNGPHFFTESDGARSKDPLKAAKDIAALTNAAILDPDPRYEFFLGIHHHKAGNYSEALTRFTNFTNETDPEDRVRRGMLYVAYLNIGRILMEPKAQEKLREAAAWQENFESEAVYAFSTAAELCPTRCEALCELAILHARKAANRVEGFQAESQGLWHWAKIFALAAVQSPLPSEMEFMEVRWKSWAALDILCVALINLGQYSLALPYLTILERQPALPESERPRILDQIEHIKEALQPK